MMKNLFGSLLIVLISFSTQAQLRFAKDIPEELQSKISFLPLPSKGTFASCQIAAINHIEWLDGDDELLSYLAALNQVYYKQDNGMMYLSLGLYNDLAPARDLAFRMKKFFDGPFAVVYNDGRRIHTGAFREGNIKEKPVNLKKVQKRLKKWLKKDYYRIQIGYFEKEGYEPGIQSRIDKLKEGGYSLIEESYKNGRILLIDQVFTKYSEASDTRMEVYNEIGIWPKLKRYYHHEDLKYWQLDWMHFMWDNL